MNKSLLQDSDMSDTSSVSFDSDDLISEDGLGNSHLSMDNDVATFRNDSDNSDVESNQEKLKSHAMALSMYESARPILPKSILEFKQVQKPFSLLRVAILTWILIFSIYVVSGFLHSRQDIKIQELKVNVAPQNDIMIPPVQSPAIVFSFYAGIHRLEPVFKELKSVGVDLMHTTQKSIKILAPKMMKSVGNIVQKEGSRVKFVVETKTLVVIEKSTETIQFFTHASKQAALAVGQAFHDTFKSIQVFLSGPFAQQLQALVTFSKNLFFNVSHGLGRIVYDTNKLFKL